MGSIGQRLIVLGIGMSMVVATSGCGGKSHDTVAGDDGDDPKSSGSHAKKPNHAGADDDEGDADDSASDDSKITTGPAKVQDDGTVNFNFDVAVPAGQELFKCIYG